MKTNSKIILLFDLFLRFSGLGGKFLLLVFISKYLDISIVGEYGLITGLVTVMLYFVGMDLYTYTTREVITKKVTVWMSLYNQFLFYIFNYIILFLMWGWLAPLSGVKGSLWLIFSLLIVEHLSQEIYRVLIILNKITIANIQLFIRTGLWCYLAIVLMLNVPLTLIEIITMWFYCSLISCLFALMCTYKAQKPSLSDFKIQKYWLLKGVKVASVFFMGTLMLRCVFYFDKILINHLSSQLFVGIYVFFLGIANSVQSALDVIVISRYYPSYVDAVHRKDSVVMKHYQNIMLKLLMFLGAGLFVLSIPVCWYLVLLLNKSAYIEFFYMYPLLCFAIWLGNISLVSHYFLFGVREDIYILKCNIAMLLTFFIMFFICFYVFHFALLAIILALMIANLVLYVFKKWKFNQLAFLGGK